MSPEKKTAMCSCGHTEKQHLDGECTDCGCIAFRELLDSDDPRIKPDWKTPCEVCGAVPSMPLTGMCGPCTFGEAETKDGNW